MKKVIFILVLVLAFSGIVLAASTVTLGSYHIELIGGAPQNNGDGTYTFAYGIIGEKVEGNFADLSHWVLDICPTTLVSPQDGDLYTTASCDYYGYPQCDETLVKAYVETKFDPDDPFEYFDFGGIKFDIHPQTDLGNNEGAVFEIVTTSDEMQEVNVGVKYAQWVHTGKIDGPVCEPTAVSLGDMSAQADNNGTLLFIVFCLAVITILWLVYRKR